MCYLNLHLRWCSRLRKGCPNRSRAPEAEHVVVCGGRCGLQASISPSLGASDTSSPEAHPGLLNGLDLSICCLGSHLASGRGATHRSMELPAEFLAEQFYARSLPGQWSTCMVKPAPRSSRESHAAQAHSCENGSHSLWPGTRSPPDTRRNTELPFLRKRTPTHCRSEASSAMGGAPLKGSLISCETWE